jgi:hypothetical protein
MLVVVEEDHIRQAHQRLEVVDWAAGLTAAHQM